MHHYRYVPMVELLSLIDDTNQVPDDKTDDHIIDWKRRWGLKWNEFKARWDETGEMIV
jgi:hypothetical protein